MGNKASGSPSGYFNQTYTVEYTVPGSLDGSTLVPTLLRVPSSDNEDPQQIYRPDVEDNVGLIDVDYVVNAPDQRGARGHRIIHVVWIDSPVVGAAGAAMQVVDAVDGPPIVQEEVAPLVGLSTFYRDRPFLVPQGSLLRLVGFTNPGPTSIKVRLSIEFTDNLVEAQEAICVCEGGEVGPPGPPGPPGNFEQEVIAAEVVNFVDVTLAAGLTQPPFDIASVALYLNGEFLQQGAGFAYVLSGGTNQSIDWLAGTGTAPNLLGTDTIITKYNFL